MELPPRARRILLICPVRACAGGTTSACAENTESSGAVPGLPRNYLRVRGEYAVSFVNSAPNWELPPRARRIRAEKPGPSRG